jgi:hypothetical protein
MFVQNNIKRRHIHMACPARKFKKENISQLYSDYINCWPADKIYLGESPMSVKNNKSKPTGSSDVIQHVPHAIVKDRPSSKGLGEWIIIFSIITHHHSFNKWEPEKYELKLWENRHM